MAVYDWSHKPELGLLPSTPSRTMQRVPCQVCGGSAKWFPWLIIYGRAIFHWDVEVYCLRCDKWYKMWGTWK